MRLPLCSAVDQGCFQLEGHGGGSWRCSTCQHHDTTCVGEQGACRSVEVPAARWHCCPGAHGLFDALKQPSSTSAPSCSVCTSGHAPGSMCLCQCPGGGIYRIGRYRSGGSGIRRPRAERVIPPLELLCRPAGPKPQTSVHISAACRANTLHSASPQTASEPSPTRRARGHSAPVAA